MRSLIINIVSFVLMSLLVVGVGVLVYGTLNRLFRKPFFEDMKDRMIFWYCVIVGGFLLDQPLHHLARIAGIVK